MADWLDDCSDVVLEGKDIFDWAETADHWHTIATRLAARLRVHASSSSTGYRQDPLSLNDPDAPTEPGMSDRWCVRDQYALADYEALENQ